MCRHKGKKEYVEPFRHMYTVAVDGYRHSTNCVHIIVVAYLYERLLDRLREDERRGLHHLIDPVHLIAL
jgi:hypothetical protein